MSEDWYYVLEGERQGPVKIQDVKDLKSNGVLNGSDYVWKKGLENWITIEECSDFKLEKSNPAESFTQEDTSIPGVIDENFDISKRDLQIKDIFIKVGADRGGQEVEYGPFSLEILKKLYKEKRINAKTFIFHKSLHGWKILSDVTGFENIFEEVPPPIEEKDKRAFKRKPLIARMFIESHNKVFEGICRDLSIGGMQVLVDNFPAKVGNKISINVHPDNLEHHFVASGEVVRVLEGGLGFSFRFIDLNKDAINSINSYIG